MSLNWMVIRQQGCAWAVPAARIERVVAAGSGCTLEVGGHRLAAEDVLGTPRSLQVLPLGKVTRAMLAAGCRGFSVWDEQPVVVIDPEEPPLALRVKEDEDKVELEESDHEI